MALLDKLKFWESDAPIVIEQTAESLSDLPIGVQEQIELEVLQKHTGAHRYNMTDFKESFRDFKDTHDVSDYGVSNALSSIYTRVSQVRKQLFKTVENIRNFYLAEAVIDQIAEDALVPDITTGEILEVTSKKKDISARIERIEELWNIDKLVLAITPDLIAHGDYTLSTEVLNAQQQGEEKKIAEAKGDPFDEKDDVGLLELRDDVCQPNVVPISEFGETEGYLVQDDKGRIAIKEPADFIHFSLDSKRVRIDTHECFINGYANGMAVNKDILKDIPRYLRVGRGIIHGVVGKFKELELLEQLVPASKLQKLSNGTLLGVNVPPGYDLDKGQKAAKKIESVINKKLGVDTKNSEISLENIMNATGSVKVVPLFGDKGRLELLQTRSDEPDDLLNSIEDLRRVIMGSIGTPYEILFGGEGAKGELLKRYARYLRLLKNVQRAICAGVKQIVMIDLANAGIDFKPTDIEVNFRTRLIEINNLDELEFADTTVQMISNIRNFIFEISDTEQSPIAGNINMKEFVLYLDKQFRAIGLPDLIDTKKEPLQDVPGSFDADDPEDLPPEDDEEEPEPEPKEEPEPKGKDDGKEVQ